MNKEDINELLEYNNEYMEAQISEEIFGGDYTSAVELKYAQQELERYKNTIDELENFILNHYIVGHKVQNASLDDILNKLKELKEENNIW